MEDYVEEGRNYKVTLLYGKGREKSFIRYAEKMTDLLKEIEQVYHVGEGYVGAVISAID